MAADDIFQRINELDKTAVEKIVERLEFRDQNPTFTQWREAYLDQLPLATATHILDVGCGTGVVTRALAKRASSTCHVIGSDYSPALIDVARKKAVELMSNRRIDFQVNDVHSLGFADGTFDIVVAHTVISHVANPEAALREIQRVVKPGGMVTIFDGDYASMTYAYPDEAFAKQFEAAFLQVVVANPRVMRNLPQTLNSLGLEIVTVIGHVLAEVGTGQYWPSAMETFAPQVSDRGLLPEASVSEWLAWQRQAVETGHFFAASNFYTYITRRTT